MIYLLDYIASFTGQLAIIYSYTKLANKNMKLNYYLWLIIAITTALQLMLNVIISNIMVASLSLLYFYSLFKYKYKSSNKDVVLYTVFIWSVSILIDIILMLFMNLMHVGNDDGMITLFYKGVSTIVLSTFLIIFFSNNWVLRKVNDLKKIINLKEIKTSKIVTLIIMLFVIGYMSSIHMESKTLIVINLSVAIVIITMIIQMIKLHYEYTTIKNTNIILEKNDFVNRNIIKEYRILKHNIENQLLGVKTIANKKAKIIINEIIKEYNESFYLKSNISNIPLGINGLVIEKLYEYKDFDIKMTLENRTKSNFLKILGSKNYNIFCESLGVILDNALQACTCSQEKYFLLCFSENDNEIVVTMINSFSGSLDIDKIGIINYTSKKNGHGLGLYYLFNKKNISYSVRIQNNKFFNVVKVKKIEKKSNSSLFSNE